MSKTEHANDEKDPEKEQDKNLHIEVPLSFHRKIKMLCILKNCTLKSYALSALAEKVSRDESEMRNEK